MADTSAARETLRLRCDEAYKAPECATSCSHAVNYVVRAVHDPGWQHRPANDLVKFLEDDKGWTKEDNMATILRLANEGVVVIGGKQESGHGHVIVVYPGTEVQCGRYTYFNKKQGKSMWLPPGKRYPRALSTSSGSWPGAKSAGDKTVWDPWGNDASFAGVGFWRPMSAM